MIFQPHRYTRTRDLMDEFTTAFGDADSLVVLDIYAASETAIDGVTGDLLAKRIAETLPGFEAVSWVGIVAPAGTPSAPAGAARPRT